MERRRKGGGRRVEEAPGGLLGQSKTHHGAVRSQPLLPVPLLRNVLVEPRAIALITGDV